MMDMFESADIIKRIMKMLGAHYGESSEFILHDMRNGLESTVIAIENNGLTGRNVGDCSSNLGFGLLRYEGKSEINDSFGYHVYFKDGRVFRSSTMHFKDENGKTVGSFCINTDITPLMNMQNYIGTLAPSSENTEYVEEFFPHDVNELLDTLIENHAKKAGKQLPTARTTSWDLTTCGTTWSSVGRIWCSGATLSPSWTRWTRS